MVFLFPTNMILRFCQKSKEDPLPKNTLKNDISGIIEKDDIHPRKYGIFFLIEKLKVIKNLLSRKRI